MSNWTLNDVGTWVLDGTDYTVRESRGSYHVRCRGAYAGEHASLTGAKVIAEALNTRTDTLKVLDVLNRSLKLIDDLMPGVKNLALQDYAQINDVPLAIKELIRDLGGARG